MRATESARSENARNLSRFFNESGYIYKFACRNYRSEDDEIYGFGFSRGAFTLRVVAGLILNQGLIVTDSEEDLDAKAIAAYRAFRREKFHTIHHLEDVARWLRDLIIRSDYSK